MRLEFNAQYRKRLRLTGCDYKNAGYYFVTICTNNRQMLFGHIKDHIMYLNSAGRMIKDTMTSINSNYPGWDTDEYIVMPDHLHILIKLDLNNESQTKILSLTELIRNLKSLTTFNYSQGVLMKRWDPYENRLWQRSYHEHIIRCTDNLDNIRMYIRDNPLKWHNHS